MLKNLKHSFTLLTVIIFSFSSCATSIKWEGKMSKHVNAYTKVFDKFRHNICVPRAEEVFQEKLKNYRGQGYWIPELGEDVDVESIRSLLPEMEAKVSWIKKQRNALAVSRLPTQNVTAPVRNLLKKLLNLKKTEILTDEPAKVKSRKESLKLLGDLKSSYSRLISKIPFLSNYNYPVDHLKNRKVHEQYREKSDDASVKIANYTFLYRKILEDGAYNKDHTSSDIYLRTTLDTLHFELLGHDFYLSEDARYDLEFVLDKIESELERGKNKILERLAEWEERSEKALKFYQSLTFSENNKEIVLEGKKTTRNRELIKEHNKATFELKEFVYKKQAEVYKFWLNQPELLRAIFVLETILINEVGGVDGEDALERMDVARVVINRLDKPKYLAIGKSEFIHPYLKQVTSDFNLKHDRWLNALFKQGEFSFTYYYMSGVAKIFCPDMAPTAKKLRKRNIQIAFQVLKEEDNNFKATRYFSRASMIGRIHMDSIWEDYASYPERPGLLASGQAKLLGAFKRNEYSYLYSFTDPSGQQYQVLKIDETNYVLSEKGGLKIFYQHRNPHYFRYFIRNEVP